jgi:antitoxin (DNA-binding transcriptional repressor) of toxin-antitoxin stability system
MAKTAGVRELKNHLSEYLQQVRCGAVVSITDRGQVVAELRAPSPRAHINAYDHLVEEGGVIPPTREWSAVLVPSQRGGKRFARGFATALVDADRDER